MALLESTSFLSHYVSTQEGSQETQTAVKLQYKGLDYSILLPPRFFFCLIVLLDPPYFPAS